MLGMQEIMKLVKNMVLELLHGKMVESITETGLMANNTAMELISKTAKREKAYGKKARELNG